MLVLLFSEAGSTKSLGPVSAIGVACALLAGLTLLPAMLTAFGRNGFWPRAGTVAYKPERGARGAAGLWRRFGDRVLKRPGLAFGATVALFALLLARPARRIKEDYSIGGAFKKDVESVTGFDVLAESFPAGASQPTAVIVRRTDGQPATDADVEAARKRIVGVAGVAAVTASRCARRTASSRASTSCSRTTPTARRRWRGWTSSATGSTTSAGGRGAARRGQRGAGGLQRGGRARPARDRAGRAARHHGDPRRSCSRRSWPRSS